MSGKNERLCRDRYRAVFFDAGGTLIYAPLEKTFVDICSQYGIHLDIKSVLGAYEVFVREDGSYFKRNREMAQQDPVRFWNLCNKQMLDYLGVEGDTDRIARQITEVYPTSLTIHWMVYPDVSDSLQKLKGMGFYLGVISNFDPFLKDILTRLDLAQFFAVVAISTEVGVLKPDSGIFQFAVEEVGVGAGESLYVGDLYDTDVVGARQAGLTPIFIDRKNRRDNVDCIKINGLGELVEILASDAP